MTEPIRAASKADPQSARFWIGAGLLLLGLTLVVWVLSGGDPASGLLFSGFFLSYGISLRPKPLLSRRFWRAVAAICAVAALVLAVGGLFG